MLRPPKNNREAQAAWEEYIRLKKIDRNVARKWLKYASENGWTKMMPYDYYLWSCLEDPSLLPDSLITLKQHGRMEELERLALEVVEKTDRAKIGELAKHTNLVLETLPGEVRLKYARLLAERLEPEQLGPVLPLVFRLLRGEDVEALIEALRGRVPDRVVEAARTLANP